MIKLEALEHESLPFSVNPHLVQPALEQPLEDLLIEKNLVNQEDVQLLPTVDGSVRMEHCINLDWYLAPIPDTMESFYTDELDTPDTFVSEARNDLNKIINTTTHQKQSDGNPFNFTAASAQPIETPSAKTTSIRDLKPTIKSIENTMNNFINFGKDQILNNAIAETIMADPWSIPEAGDNSTADCGNLLSPSRFDMDEDININEYDFLLDCQDAIDADMANDVNIMFGVDSHADNSIDNNSTIEEHHNYALKLNISQKFPMVGETLQTPDIISQILQIENPQDYKFAYITPEEIKEEISLSPQSNHSPHPQSPETPETLVQDDESSSQSTASSSTVATSSTKTTRTRRRKPISDDEEYVPHAQPARKTIKRRVSPPIKIEDVDDEDYIPEKLPKRGRPAKPVSARSSESSECSKYREMRDKNNEASRRSRRKRRLQEENIEEECEQLNMRNIRLKAQVEELEKSVTTYRNTVMGLLLKK